MNDTSLDLIVTFLWTTLSRSNCDLFMNDYLDLIVTFFMNDTV